MRRRLIDIFAAIRRRLVYIFAFLAVLLVSAVFSYWMLFFAILGGVYALFRLTEDSKKKIRLAPLFVVGTGLGLFLLFFLGVLRPTKRIGACVNGPTARVENLVRGRPANPVPRASVTPFEAQFRKKALQNEAWASETLYTDAIRNQITSFVQQERPDQQVPDVVDLRSKLVDLLSFLKDNAASGMNDPVLRRNGEKDLEKKLEDLVARIPAAKTPRDQRNLDDDLDRLVTNSPYFGLQLKLSSIQQLQQRLSNEDIKVSVVPRILVTGSRSEDGAQKADLMIFEEAVTLTAARGQLVEADAHLLAQEARLDGFQYELLLNQNGKESKPDDVEHVYFVPDSRTATLVSRRSAPLDGEPCSAGRLSGIRHLDLRWPQPYSTHIAVLSRIPRFGDVVSAVELDRSAKIKEIRVPQWSYFAAKEDLEVTHNEGSDILKDPKDQITQAALAGSDPFWIEIFRDTPLLRNPLIQPARAYLIAENAFSGVILMLLGLVISDRILKG
jgi:hypothetical protein